jgi:translocation and assembly module TamA
VLVQLKEAPMQNATLGVGYGSNTGPRVSAEHIHRRVFGFAATARNKIEYGRDKQAWDGEVSLHPNEKMQRYLIGGTYELLKTDEDRTISQRVRLGRSEDLPRLERLAFLQLERSNECSYVDSACIDPLTLKAVSANLHNTWRRLDNELLPTRGYALNLQMGTGWAMGEAPQRVPSEQPAPGPYARLYGRLTGYWPLPHGFYGEARVELGGVLSKNDVIVPDSQRFRAGGDDSVRGYDYRTLAPATPEGGLTGGKLLFTTSVEVAHPISRNLPSVWWAAFVDAGRAADSMGRTSDPSDPEGVRTLPGLREPAVGYGVGVRWRSPVGPLKLDLAYGQELAQWRVHLSVGVAF